MIHPILIIINILNGGRLEEPPFLFKINHLLEFYGPSILLFIFLDFIYIIESKRLRDLCF